MTSKPAKVIEVFISYAQEDERLMHKLEKHLTTLKHQGYITFWNNLRINAGKEWNNEINIHLNSAHVILLLISSDFMSSDYCTSVEVKKALLRHDAGECRVIPIILRPVYWRIAPVSKLQPLPVDGKPVTEWHNKDKAFANIVEEIQKAIDELFVDPLIEPSEALSAAKQPQLPVHSMTLSPTEPESKELSLNMRERQMPSLTVQQVRDAWDRVKKRTRQRNELAAATLTRCRIVAIEGTDKEPVVVLHLASEAHYKIVNDRSKDVEWALSTEFGQNCRISLLAPGSQLKLHSSLSLQQVKNAWDKVIKRVKQKAPVTAAMLKYFEVVGVEDRDDQTVIAIQAQKQGHFNYVCENDRSKDVEWALMIEFGQFGRPCEIRLLPPGNP